jgi:hypothetical protein
MLIRMKKPQTAFGLWLLEIFQYQNIPIYHSYLNGKTFESFTVESVIKVFKRSISSI